ncbi:hypothetical protein OAO87_02965 [bacterium]|nr:hypothetical protein [bacterium]
MPASVKSFAEWELECVVWLLCAHGPPEAYLGLLTVHGGTQRCAPCWGGARERIESDGRAQTRSAHVWRDPVELRSIHIRSTDRGRVCHAHRLLRTRSPAFGKWCSTTCAACYVMLCYAMLCGAPPPAPR